MDDAKIIELCFARNEEAVRALEEKYGITLRMQSFFDRKTEDNDSFF